MGRTNTAPAVAEERYGEQQDLQLLNALGSLTLSRMNQTPGQFGAAIHADRGNAAMLRLAGDWTLAAPLPDVGALASEVGRKSELKQLKVDASRAGTLGLGAAGISLRACRQCSAHGVTLVADAAPEGLRRLLAIAQAVPQRAELRAGGSTEPACPARAGRAVLVGRHRRRRELHRRGRPGSARIPARAREVPGRGRGARVRSRGAAGTADRHPDRAPRRLHPGLRRRQRARAVRRADLRRQPGHDRDGAGDGPAHGGGDHGRAHRCRLRRRARHDAGQPGDRRAAHARRRPGAVSGRAADAGPDADAAAARLLRHAHGDPGRRRSSVSRSSASTRCNTRSRCG